MVSKKGFRGLGLPACMMIFALALSNKRAEKYESWRARAPEPKGSVQARTA